MKISITNHHGSRHLEEACLVSIQSKHKDRYRCFFCGGAFLQKVWSLQKDPEIFLLECLSCFAISASRMPNSEALHNYYNSYYENSKNELVTFHTPHLLAKNITEKFKPFLTESISILDFGGGDGVVSYLVAKNLISLGAVSVNVTIVDYEGRTIQAQDSRIKIFKIPELNLFSKKQYSLVIASAVIEHYPEAGVLLKTLLNCVEVGGVFYSRTPQMIQIMRLARHFGINVDFTYPGHLHDLGQRFWNHYFEKIALDYDLVRSSPSIVETSFSNDFFRTLLAHSLKKFSHLLSPSNKLVGGWEVLAVRRGNLRHK